MANIKIPESLNFLLQRDQKLDGIVKKTMSDFGEILKENNLYFFEEYTDHGIDHIQNVIYGSSKLITNDTLKNILKSEDIAIYILSVILHDIGMHLNFDGFKMLLSGKYDDLTPDLSELSWRSLWENYLSEAKRFSGKQLISIFGCDDIEIKDVSSLKLDELKGYDRKLVGEFIRRHHPRIAHEIAIKGYPGKGNEIIPFAIDLNKKLLNLIGFIARSHGMSLRKCVEFLEQKYGDSRRIPLGIHASYLMILLRISDYLQIDNSRVSEIIMKTKTFESPMSEIEQNAHLAIDYIDDMYQDDPERIYVSAAPKDSFMYLKLKKLFKSIQREFDISWAVLGELYGNLDIKPSIKFRRISSNLDSQNYINNEAFIGDYISFRANDDITKLLIGPLYGNDPKYGIRELLQNSIDACNERVKVEKLKSDYTPEVQIEVTKVGKGTFFYIKDNGKGMSLDEIKNYFLSAGASYRKSREWKEKYIDEEGNSIVQRNGRFGIGVLAAFLIGKNIIVRTKKVNSDYGYSFEANLDKDQINILKDKNIDFGTHITIEIDKEIINKLNNQKRTYNENVLWTDWYTLKKPKLNIIFLGKKIKAYKNYDPHYLDSIIPIDWNYFDANGYNKILWTYSSNYSDRDLVCNGIAIPIEDARYDEKKIIDIGLFRTRPKISIFDNNGITPLSLNRNNLSENLDFNTELKESIYRDYIAYLLTFKDLTTVKKNIIRINDQVLSYPGLSSAYDKSKNKFSTGFGEFYYFQGSHLLREVLVSKKGYIVRYNYFITRLEPSIKLIYMQSFNYQVISDLELDLKNNFLAISNDKSDSIEHYKSMIVKSTNYHNSHENLNEDRYADKVNRDYEYEANFFLKQTKFKYLFENRLPKWVSNHLIYNVKRIGDWVHMEADNPEKSIITEKFLKKNLHNFNFIREAPLRCEFSGDEIFNKLLNKYIGDDVIIPFDIEDRKKKFPLAFKELHRYMEKYTAS